MKSLQGQMLVAKPQMGDPNFAETVVLVLEHSEDGAFGLILNRPTNKTIRQLWKEADLGECDVEEPIYWGGPVRGPLMALHTQGDLADSPCIAGAYFSTDVRGVLDENQLPFRIYSGYAGWGEGQLDRECRQDDWIIAPAQFRYIFAEDGNLWRRVLSDIAPQTIFASLKVDHPEDPSLN